MKTSGVSHNSIFCDRTHASLRGRFAPHNGVGVVATIYKREPSEAQVIHEVTRPEPVPSLIGRVLVPQKPAMAGSCKSKKV